jgi:RNA polymerase sigma factor (sigma-70 family)
MSKTALAHLLDRWAGARDGDPDPLLLTRFLATRDESAFAALVQRHGPLVYGTCLRILGNRHDADDAFQAAFFVLARRAHALRPDRGIGPWLYGVALRVARKLRGQIVRRRLREMAAARSERVAAAEPQHDFWAVIDEELARLPAPLREALLLCDLGGQSHAQAAASLGLAKGTVTKRVARAREALATRLKRRGITLGAGALAATVAAHARASVPAPLLVETARQAVAWSAGQAAGSAVATTLAAQVLRSLRIGVLKVWLVLGLLGLTLAGGGLMLAGKPAPPGEEKPGRPQAKADAKPQAAAGTMWKECYAAEYEHSLPVSVAFSADGKTLLTSDTAGEVMALMFPHDPPMYRWKSKADGAHAAVAYSADRKTVYATTANGVRILDAATGRDVARIDAPGSNPVAIGVFPNTTDAGPSRAQIVFGSARGYFVKTWVEGGNPADTLGTIETSTVAKGAKPADAAAVPLAVDPKGRSAIMTGPRDATGQLTGRKGVNVLWAYTCGDHSKGSPGNRLMVGHAATVVCAAWARDGGTAVTGDARGRVIVWDAKTMKESRRIELGGRVMAVAVSDDGTHTAAYVRGKRGGEVYVWRTARPADATKPIYTEPADLRAPYASLAFSADGKRLAGCAIDKSWLGPDHRARRGGRVRVWELAPEPKAQPAPRPAYTKPLPRGGSDFAVLGNLEFLKVAAKEGALDFHDVRDGHIQFRLTLGKFALGTTRISSDRKWLALEQHPLAANAGGADPTGAVDVCVYGWPSLEKGKTLSCGRLLDVASGGKAVAVARGKQIELWDPVAGKKRKAAPFQYTQIDAARFSPDGKLLAVADPSGLLLWRWEEDKHVRLDLGRRVGSLAFSPDGTFLAEGPARGEDIRIRDVETGKVVRTLADGTRRPMSVAAMAYTQGGRVLIACDNVTSGKGGTVPRLTLWDTATGAVAHRVALTAGLPVGMDITPNGRYLAVLLDEGRSGRKLRVWRLDGEAPVPEPVGAPPATAGPR